MNIPDLRPEHDEITLEHCYVLLARLSDAFDLIEGTPGMHKDIQIVDPTVMKDHFDNVFEPREFSRLFGTEMGKGVLVGTFAQRILEKIEGDAANDTDI